MTEHAKEFIDQYRHVFDSHKKELGDNDALFLDRVFSDGISPYKDRLQSLGFAKKAHVLDAGCGFGQWSLALASLNERVSACDVSQLRVDFLCDMARQLDITNVSTKTSGIDIMPYPDNFFDLIFCYGVIFLTPWRQSLRELSRVLKPGGKLYVNANGLGWYNYLWNEEHNKADDYDPKAVVAKAFADTLNYEREGIHKLGMNLIIDPENLRSELQSNGFVNVQQANEGELHLNHDAAAPKPFFRGEYYGQDGVHEAVCTKAAV
jgi:ubiquinone/menaquinone biosynthesis C-methylase UbiE